MHLVTLAVGGLDHRGSLLPHGLAVRHGGDRLALGMCFSFWDFRGASVIDEGPLDLFRSGGALRVVEVATQVQSSNVSQQGEGAGQAVGRKSVLDGERHVPGSEPGESLALLIHHHCAAP